MPHLSKQHELNTCSHIVLQTADIGEAEAWTVVEVAAVTSTFFRHTPRHSACEHGVKG